MSYVLRRSYIRAKNNLLHQCTGTTTQTHKIIVFSTRKIGNDGDYKNNEYSSSTILAENRNNVQELPIVVRKLSDPLSEEKVTEESQQQETDNNNYKLIQTEFRECLTLRDIFSLLSKCTKITPNIALGAMERIYDLEKNPHHMDVDPKNHINFAKGAIIDKLLRLVMKTEDTQTILNALNATLPFMDPYKYRFSDELLLRAIDNKLTIEQLCAFMQFLILNKVDIKYCDTIDKLWVGFVQRENQINASNLSLIFSLLPFMKESKRAIMNLLSHHFSELWFKVDVQSMLEILDVFRREKYISNQCLEVAGKWFYTNIHALDEDALLDIITKFTELRYSDEPVEKAIEKYVRLRGHKIKSQMLVVGILSFCLQLRIQNIYIMQGCSYYVLHHMQSVPYSFLCSILFPFGFLNVVPHNSDEFFSEAEKAVQSNFEKMMPNDIASIIISFIYLDRHPITLVKRLLDADYLASIKINELLKSKLYLIDTTFSLECNNYSGPLLPKNHCSKTMSHDGRLQVLIKKIKNNFEEVAGGSGKVSTFLFIPQLQFDNTYLIDVMIHPEGCGGDTFNWKAKCLTNENTAILIHLPEHYTNESHLIGPQVMKKRHLKLLGMKVVSLRYALLIDFLATKRISELQSYLFNSIEKAEFF